MYRITPRLLNEYIGLNGGHIIKKKLQHYNISHVFGYCGGCNLPILDGFHNSENPKFVPTCTEQGAGFMATGYAKSSGRPGVAVTTSGPGMTNIVTSLYDANADHVPLIVLSGQVTTSAIGTDAFQEAPATELARPVTKWAYQLEDINHLPIIMDRAYNISMQDPKGSVLIDLPKDLMVQKCSTSDTDDMSNNSQRNDAFIPDTTLQEVAELINNAKHPIIFVGQGAKHAYKLVRLLAQKSCIPVTSSLHGLGIFDENKYLSLKMVGMHGSAAANYAIQEADLIIGIGVRFDDRTIGTVCTYAPKAYQAYQNKTGGIISINVETSKTIKPHFHYNYDCKKFLGLLIHKITKQFRREWYEHILILKSKYLFRYNRNDELKVQDILFELDRKINNRDFVISTGVGNHQMFTSMYIRFDRPNKILTSGSAGTMGVCLPYLIGAYYAYLNTPEPKLIPNGNQKLFIGIDGDGSFNMTHNELQHISRFGIPIKLFIMHDKQLQMVATWQDLFFDGRIIGTDSYNPDYSKLADAWGIRCVQIRDRNELEQALTLINSPEPIIFDCHVKPTYCLPLVAPGKALDDMILEQSTLTLTKFDKSETPS